MEKIIEQELQSNFSTVFPDAYLKIRESYLLDLHSKYDPLREEICKCITFGLFQASITLTNHLLELMLKDGLMFNYCGTSQFGGVNNLEKFNQARDKFDNLDLSETINRSCSVGIIDKSEKEKLHIFRESYRNSYNHAEKNKLFGTDPINIASGTLDISTPIETGTIEASSFFIMHGEMQKHKAANDAVPYFLYVDKILCREEKKRHPEIEQRPELYIREFNFSNP